MYALPNIWIPRKSEKKIFAVCLAAVAATTVARCVCSLSVEFWKWVKCKSEWEYDLKFKSEKSERAKDDMTTIVKHTSHAKQIRRESVCVCVCMTDSKRKVLDEDKWRISVYAC